MAYEGPLRSWSDNVCDYCVHLRRCGAEICESLFDPHVSGDWTPDDDLVGSGSKSVVDQDVLRSLLLPVLRCFGSVCRLPIVPVRIGMLSANDRRRVLIVDNGAIAVDDTGRRYVNNHTGQFACDIRHEGCEPAFIAPNAPYDENGQLYNFCLVESRLLAMRPRVRVRSPPRNSSVKSSRVILSISFFRERLGRRQGSCVLLWESLMASMFAAAGFARRGWTGALSKKRHSR